MQDSFCCNSLFTTEYELAGVSSNNSNTFTFTLIPAISYISIFIYTLVYVRNTYINVKEQKAIKLVFKLFI